MSVISAVLPGSPTTPLLKSLASAIGGSVMDLRHDWLEGKPIMWFELPGRDLEHNASTLTELLAWADREGVLIELHETDNLLPPPGSRPNPTPRALVLNALETAFEIKKEVRSHG